MRRPDPDKWQTLHENNKHELIVYSPELQQVKFWLIWRSEPRLYDFSPKTLTGVTPEDIPEVLPFAIEWLSE